MNKIILGIILAIVVVISAFLDSNLLGAEQSAPRVVKQDTLYRCKQFAVTQPAGTYLSVMPKDKYGQWGPMFVFTEDNQPVVVLQVLTTSAQVPDVLDHVRLVEQHTARWKALQDGAVNVDLSDTKVVEEPDGGPNALLASFTREYPDASIVRGMMLYRYLGGHTYILVATAKNEELWLKYKRQVITAMFSLEGKTKQ